MTVLITLLSAGADTGPFDLYSNVDGFVSAFETGVSKAALLAGYPSALVPPGTTTIRVKSNGRCVNYIDLAVLVTTTTTTTLVPPPSTTTTTSSLTSSTTSTTTTAIPCDEYYNNTGSDLVGIDFTGCNGISYTNQIVGPGQSICIVPGTLSGGDSGFLILLGNC
jgi:hypothetical protein